MPENASILLARSRPSARPRPRSRIVAIPEPPPVPEVPVWPGWMQVVRGTGARGPRRSPRSRILGPEPFRADHRLDLRGCYRIFGDAEYRFYRSNTGPPEMGGAMAAPVKRSLGGDTFAAWSFRSATWRGLRGAGAYETSPTLPYTSVATFADGTWWLSVSWFNGVLESGFLPIGTQGETFVRLDIAAGAATLGPPYGPMDWRIEAIEGGVVRIVGVYFQTDALRAEQWAIAYTTDGTDPPEDTPDLTEDIAASGPAILDYELPAQADGTTVKVRIQTRRQDDATWAYSEDSTIQTITADNAGPPAPETAQ